MTEEFGLVGVLSNNIYQPEKVLAEDVFFNSDIYDYCSKFNMILPAYHFEIIKKGGKSL
jgi:hypothetical protein